MQTYLFTFWNQLAYEFTNLYSNLDDKLHNTLVAIQENTEHITKNASESAKKIIDNQDKNTSDIKKNDDKNTDKALNGYDNSDMNNNSTNKLDEAFKKQDEAEKQATNKANEEFKTLNLIIRLCSMQELFLQLVLLCKIYLMLWIRFMMQLCFNFLSLLQLFGILL